MRAFAKPNVVISKCLGFAPCRWNGAVISDDFTESLKPYVSFQPVCPEVEIALGVPRDPIRVVDRGGKPGLVQPATGKDITDKMHQFAESFLRPLQDIDGFILKSRSPSCGIKDVKIYPAIDKAVPLRKDRGFFGGAVLQNFPHLAVEDEGRLHNFRIRDHFLTKLFALASFRRVKSSNSMRDLVQFQAQNKFLLMAYHQKELRILGRIVANPQKRPLGEVLTDYEVHLAAAFARPSRYLSNINVLMHTLGFFSKKLSAGEKAFFLDALERYRAKKVPLSVPLNLARAWVVRFGEEYLGPQTFFEPYPQALMKITDSGKGRNL
jgi:uncharacterized protein YbgA (DUF1722 family)/uncharacterized protein YbbK (DUF523 family)